MKKYLSLLILSLFLACSVDDGGVDSSSSSTLNGSYSNMLVVDNFLYAVSDIELITFSLMNADDPIEIDRQELVFGVESLFHRNGILFIGSTTRMYIYSIGQDGIPVQNSETAYSPSGFSIEHCDPIAANDTLAVASLSSRIEGQCSQVNVNELRFFDITDINAPIQIHEIAMSEPKGLTLDGNHLFVCEAENGIKVFDISTPGYDLVFHYPGLETFDVIATGELLLVVGPTQLYEFDYQDINNIILLGQLDF